MAIVAQDTPSTMHSSSAARKDAYKRISAVALRMRSLCTGDASAMPSVTTNDFTMVPPLLLPAPKPCSIDLECLPAISASMSDAFIMSAHQLQAMFQSKYRNMAAFLLSDITGASALPDLQTFFQQQYQAQISLLERSATARVLHLKGFKQNAVKAKPSFNQEFVPLLEKYFQYNAYPSAPDRTALARKSMMTSRQIEVWFQNHRNRAKKEGKILRRLTSDSLPLTLSLESLEQRMPFFIIPENERKDPSTTSIPEDESDQDSDDEAFHHVITCEPHATFSSEAPLHAFPSPYRPSCDSHSFSNPSKRCTFPKPAWLRKPATTLSSRSTGDFDDFVADFAIKLALREAPQAKHGHKNDLPSARNKQLWYAATRTIVSCAPHPALIRPSCYATSRHLTSIPTVPALSSCVHSFRSPNPSSQPASLVPHPQTATAVLRKVARLPKPTSKHQNMAHRGVSPATTEASLSPSSRSSSTSRVSSSDSDSSTRRRSSSSSSSSSSSTVTTPVLSPTLLPEHAQSPVSVAGVDFQDLECLFGDPPNTVSPDDGLQLCFPGELPFDTPAFNEKECFGFGFEVPSLGHARERS